MGGGGGKGEGCFKGGVDGVGVGGVDTICGVLGFGNTRKRSSVSSAVIG